MKTKKEVEEELVKWQKKRKEWNSDQMVPYVEMITWISACKWFLSDGK